MKKLFVLLLLLTTINLFSAVYVREVQRDFTSLSIKVTLSNGLSYQGPVYNCYLSSDSSNAVCYLYMNSNSYKLDPTKLTYPSVGSNAALFAAVNIMLAPVPPCSGSSTDSAAWHINGNVTGATSWIGSIDNYDFDIKTNNTLRFHIKNSGTITAYGSISYNAYYTLSATSLVPKSYADSVGLIYTDSSLTPHGHLYRTGNVVHYKYFFEPENHYEYYDIERKE